MPTAAIRIPVLVLATVLAAAEPAQLEPLTGHWQQAAGVWQPDQAAAWSIALATTTVAERVAAEVTATVRQSGVTVLPRSMHGRMVTYGADLFGETEAGADLALILAYNQKPGEALPSYYRVEVSAHKLAGHIAIWKTGGCYVAVKPFTAPLGKAFRLGAALDRDGSLRVSVDGTELLAYRDPFLLPPGRTGVATLRGVVDIAGLGVQPLDQPVAVPPRTVADFRLRRWYADGPLAKTWLFDGDEPVFRLAGEVGKGVQWEWLKLRPGTMPVVMFLPFFWSQMTAEETTIGTLAEQTIERQGETFMRLKANQGDAAGAVITVSLTRDPAAGCYVYEVDSTLTLGPKAMPYRHPFEFFDPWPLAAKGSNQDFTRTPRQRWEAICWEQPDGKPPRLVNFSNDYHNSNDGKVYTANSTQKPLGRSFMGVAKDVNLAETFLADPGFPIMNEICAWGYDWHQRVYNEAWRKDGIPGGTVLHVALRMTHEEEAVLRPILAQARHISADAGKDRQLPVSELPNSGFERTISTLASRNSLLWWGGTRVEGQGRANSACIRLGQGEKLDAAGPDWCATMGNSHFTPRTWLGPWQRTLRVDVRAPEGEGRLEALIRCWNPRKAEVKQEQTVAAGAGWQTLSFDSAPLIGAILADITISNAGATPLLIDNVRFEDPPPQHRPDWVLQAEMLNPAPMAADADAVNGQALALTSQAKAGACIFEPYDTELPAGDYVGMMRAKVADPKLAGELLRWDVAQSEGAARYVPAGGAWTGAYFPAANRYVDLPIAFHRDAEGRLSLRFYQGKAAGAWSIDHVTLRRVTDAWGRELPAVRDRW